MNYLLLAVSNLRPDRSFKIDVGKKYLNDLNLTQEEVEKEIDRIKSKEQYKVDRKKEYDKLNQFELMYNDKINNTNIWQQKIEEIKQKYPKPEAKV